VAVAIVTETEPVKLPPLGVIVGVATVDWLIVNDALATPLGLYPLMNAAAFTVALVPKVNAPEYRVEDAVGLLPSVV
jgi:hypothetical protein